MSDAPAHGGACLDTNTRSAHVAVADIKWRGAFRLAIDPDGVAPDSYSVDVGVCEATWSHG